MYCTFIIASEVTLPNGGRTDVIGYNEEEHIVINEVEISYFCIQMNTKMFTCIQ